MLRWGVVFCLWMWSALEAAARRLALERAQPSACERYSGAWGQSGHLDKRWRRDCSRDLKQTEKFSVISIE